MRRPQRKGFGDAACLLASRGDGECRPRSRPGGAAIATARGRLPRRRRDSRRVRSHHLCRSVVTTLSNVQAYWHRLRSGCAGISSETDGGSTVRSTHRGRHLRDQRAEDEAASPIRDLERPPCYAASEGDLSLPRCGDRSDFSRPAKHAPRPVFWRRSADSSSRGARGLAGGVAGGNGHH